MASGERSLGLCSTCNNRAVCTQRKDLKLPVLFCEEFDDGTPEEEEESEMVSALEDEEAGRDPVHGLCCNCENRDFCTLQDSPGGVWHCEEYR